MGGRRKIRDPIPFKSPTLASKLIKKVTHHFGASMVGIVPAAINKVKEVREIFEIPKEHEAVISVILGYPKYRFKRTIKRNVQAIHWVD